MAREPHAEKEAPRRVLWAESRFRETPWRLTGELTADGYALADTPENAMARKDAEAVLAAVRATPGIHMTALRATAGIQAGKVRSVVEEMETIGLVKIEGTGKSKNDPRRIYPC